MRLSLSEHKLPVGVTTIGLLVASGLAVAPVLMAESDTDILSTKNASEIQKLTAQLQQQSDDLSQRLESQQAGISNQFKNLDAQVIVLNKAVKNMHKRSRQQAQSTEAALDELSSGPRLTNIEKAVSNLHRKQSKSANTLNASIQQSSDQSEIRIQNLEKAVKRLHLRQQQTAASSTADQSSGSTEQASKTESRIEAIEREYLAMFGRVASLENTVRLLGAVANNPVAMQSDSNQTALNQPEPDSNTTNVQPPADPQNTGNQNANDRVAELEFMVQQLLEQQQRGSTIIDQPNARSRTDGGTATRVKRLERVINRMERRINSIENSGNSQDDMVDQLYEIQDYIDQVLEQINR